MTTSQIFQIISSVTGKNVEARRIEALERAGFKVIYVGVKWGWGTSCTVREEKDTVFAQLKCARKVGTRNPKVQVNLCEIYQVVAA